MAEIVVVKAFTFTHASGEQEYFAPGNYTVSDEVANHWFVQAHTPDPPPPDVKPGTRAFANTQLAERRRADQIAAVGERQVEDAATEVRTRVRPKVTPQPEPPDGNAPGHGPLSGPTNYGTPGTLGAP